MKILMIFYTKSSKSYLLWVIGTYNSFCIVSEWKGPNPVEDTQQWIKGNKKEKGNYRSSVDSQGRIFIR